MAEKKSHVSSVEEYIALFPAEVQLILRQIRAVVKETAPQAEEKISYGMPGYFQNGGLVWFGAYKRHIGFYPWTEEMVEAISELSEYREYKGTVRFALDKPMPFELIRKMVQFRIAENKKQI